MKTLASVVTVAAATFWFCSHSFAAGGGLTEETGKDILNELRQIRNLLQGQLRPVQPAPEQPAFVKVRGAGVVLGSKDAPITMVEFTDYQCPFCRQFYGSAFPVLKKNYIDTGKVKFVSRNLPLPVHPDARNAAHAVICSGEQGRYWEMRETLFMNSNNLSAAKFPDYASNIGLDERKFRECMASDKSDKIDADMNEANSIGISGTPSFVIGRATNGEITGERVVGALPFGVFEAKIKALLEQAAAQKRDLKVRR